MKSKLDQELLLEIGGGLFAAGLIGGLLVLLWGRATGSARRGRRRRRQAPAAGSVQSERHKNIATVAAR